jgi:hypothetical protein
MISVYFLPSFLHLGPGLLGQKKAYDSAMEWYYARFSNIFSDPNV